MHFIAYNCIRCLMIEAASGRDLKVRRISFKGCVQALRQWEPHLNQASISTKEQRRLMQRLYESIAGNVVLDRPGRSEPRAVKRRPKPYSLLMEPRREMLELQKQRKSDAKTA